MRSSQRDTKKMVQRRKCVQQMRSQKGMVLYYVVIPGFILAVIYFIVLTLQAQPADQITLPTEFPLFVLAAARAGDNMLFYGEVSASFAAYDALLQLAARGGFQKEASCGTYFGYALWKKRCKPNMPESFELLFNERMDENIAQYPDRGESTAVSNLFSVRQKMGTSYYALALKGYTLAGATGKPAEVDILYRKHDPPQVIGTYAVKPTFENTLIYNFDSFRKMDESIAPFIDYFFITDTSSLNTARMKLIETAIEKADTLWKARACVPDNEKELFFDIAERIEDCALSVENAPCLCAATAGALQLLGENYEVTVGQENGKMVVRLKDKHGVVIDSYVIESDAHLGLYNPSEEFSVGELDGVDLKEIVLTAQGKGSMRLTDGSVWSFSPISGIFRTKPEQDNRLIFVADASRTTSYSAFDACSRPIKEKMRLCLETGHALVFNPQEKRMEQQPVRFKIAVDFKNEK